MDAIDVIVEASVDAIDVILVDADPRTPATTTRPTSATPTAAANATSSSSSSKIAIKFGK